jgi:tRNA threonylcarbamoyladenosine biosynthesis protein TsaB
MKFILINSNTIEPFCAFYTGKELLISYTSEFFQDETLPSKKPDKLIHSLINVTEKAIAENIPMENIDAVSVNIGPGSFTSIRVGLAIAKGVSTALNKKIIPLTDFEIELNRLNKIEDNSDYIILIPSKLPEYYYSLRNKENDTEHGFININEIKDKFDKNCILVSDFSNESVKNLNYFNSPDLTGYKKISDSMLKLTKRYYKEGRIFDSSDIKPLYIKDFVIKTDLKN